MSTNPLEDQSRWTLLGGCPCAQCRPPITEVLKDVLSDANLKITVDWTCISPPEAYSEVRATNGSHNREE
ncbi:hypothetical protein [Mycolicibacterium peregrinum]|uniref:hypothetical protein n=1 Tax=Mycolicibacterium peregrinum TaxID=43304 RepID=UPI003AAD264B